MVQDFSLRLTPEQASSESAICRYLQHEKGIDSQRLQGLRILKRSIDARQRQVFVQLQLRVFIDEQPPKTEAFSAIHYPDVSHAKSVIVVGAGPAGLFASLRLIELGYKPILVERGKNVSERKRDLASAIRTQHIQPESNYCFGEGGAGAFSDGKLYTRSKKRGNIQRILQVFHQFGASERILIEAHPHIGTDKLPRIIANMREQILLSGGEVHFNTRMTDLLIRKGRAVGILCQDGKEFHGPVILATGHSARDVYALIDHKQLTIEAKGFAMGVRLEHPQALIDRLMYHRKEGRGEYLPAAEYSFVQQVEGRGVYSFCMCPGGFVVPAGEQDDIMVVNGMSPSHRGSKWANSGMVVELRPEDLPHFQPIIDQYLQEKGDDKHRSIPLHIRMLQLQQAYERLSYLQVKQGLKAPAQAMLDFVNGKHSRQLNTTSYLPGLVASPLHEWMPTFLRSRLQLAFRLFDKNIRGFLSNEAQLIAAETRTSSPVRLPRDKEHGHLIGLEGLYPCGEGAGFAGGIVSAAIDGEWCAEACARQYNN